MLSLCSKLLMKVILYFFFPHTEANVVPPGYMTFRDVGEQSESICYRDVTSPINELDGQSNSSRGERCPEGGNGSQENGATDLISGNTRNHFHQTLSLCASSTDDSPFFENDMPTMRSSSSSEGLPHVVGLNWEGSVESNEVKKKGGKRVRHKV